jgi:serine/threonine-protein kinase ATR
LKTLSPDDVGPHVGSTSATMIANWSRLSSSGREIVRECLQHLVIVRGKELGDYIDDVVDMSGLDSLADVQAKLSKRRRQFTQERRLQAMLKRAANDNILVVLFALRELKSYMIGHREFFQSLATGDNFSPLVGRTLAALLSAASREGESSDDVRLVAYECIGALSAVDPDRFDLIGGDKRSVVVKNFTDAEENAHFAGGLIVDVLVGVFRSTGVITYQTLVAFAIQELLKFCDMTPALISKTPSSASLRARSVWNAMPKHILDTVAPLLDSRFLGIELKPPSLSIPVYPSQSSYREWLQAWTSYLITRVYGAEAKKIFHPLQSAVIRSQDVSVAHHILPHLVLHILLSENEFDVDNIRGELVAVLEDQVNPNSTSSKDKRLLSAQVSLIFSSETF